MQTKKTNHETLFPPIIMISNFLVPFSFKSITPISSYKPKGTPISSPGISCSNPTLKELLPRTIHISLQSHATLPDKPFIPFPPQSLWSSLFVQNALWPCTTSVACFRPPPSFCHSGSSATKNIFFQFFFKKKKEKKIIIFILFVCIYFGYFSNFGTIPV
jgi:hypothetical protein